MKLHDTPKPEATTKQKERHIVTWTQEEDDILREQISLHGTENWTIIAAKFKDKTTRQCRRRWYTYLNTDCKKGGWSPEEDMILCEAQKIFGNRWTEISKVVSGRTDNAVKNRFSTLCKKRAKHEALSKENNISCINPNNKRVIFQNGCIMNESSESTPPLKKMRTQILNLTENTEEGSLRKCRENHQLRPPFAVLVQNFHHVGNLSAQQHVSNNTKAASNNEVAADDKDQGTFLRRDNPKITALMQQAELLSSLALKVNTDNTNQNLENAWKELQDFLNQSKDSNLIRYRISEMNFLPGDYKHLVQDLASGNMGSQQLWSQPDLYEESPGSSEYSTGSTLQSHAAYDNQQHQAEVCSLHQDDIAGPQLPHIREAQNSFSGCDDEISAISSQEVFLSQEGSEENGVLPVFSNTEFSSPLQVTPLFQSLAAEIPTPKFSESERNFLLKTLGLGSPPLYPSTNHSQPPPCRRALLHSL